MIITGAILHMTLIAGGEAAVVNAASCECDYAA